MKKWLLHMMFVCVFGMLAASCSQEADDPTQTSDGKVQISFIFSLDDAPASRATETWGTGTHTPSEVGTGIENDIDNLQVLLFSTEGSFIGEVENAVYAPINKSNGVYEFIGNISVTSSAITSGKLVCKVMVLANYNRVTGLTSSNKIADLGNYIFTPTTFNANELQNIPMWGILNVTANDNISMIPGVRSKLADIYLLRAMAKIEVIMKATKDDNSFHQISAIQLSRYNETGYLMPTGYPNATTTLGVTDVFHPTTEISSSFLGSSNFMVTTKNIDNKNYLCYSVYVPEYKNLNLKGANDANDPVPAQINLQLNNNKDKTYEIVFKDYAQNDDVLDYNIVRNHIYRFIITDVVEDAPLGLTLTVNDWEDDKTIVDYKLEAGTNGAGKINWDGYEFLNTTTKEVLLGGYTAGGDQRPDFTNFTFNLTSPVNGTWYARLVYESTDTEAFTLAKVNGETVGNPTTGQVSGTIDGNTVTLQVAAVKTDAGSVANTNRARLLITVVTQDNSRTIDATELLSMQGVDGEKKYYTIVQNPN